MQSLMFLGCFDQKLSKKNLWRLPPLVKEVLRSLNILEEISKILIIETGNCELWAEMPIFRPSKLIMAQLRQFPKAFIEFAASFDASMSFCPPLDQPPRVNLLSMIFRFRTIQTSEIRTFEILTLTFCEKRQFLLHL